MFIPYEKKHNALGPPMTGEHHIHPKWHDEAWWQQKVVHELKLQVDNHARRRAARAAKRAQASGE